MPPRKTKRIETIELPEPDRCAPDDGEPCCGGNGPAWKIFPNETDEELLADLAALLDALDERGVNLNDHPEYTEVRTSENSFHIAPLFPLTPQESIPTVWTTTTTFTSDPEPIDDRTRITSSTGGAKETKLARYDQIPTYPLHALAEHYGAGNAKYPTAAGEQDNWRKGYNWSLSYAALQRHANAFWSGENIDAETGHAHLTAVAWHAFTLLEWTRDEHLCEQFDDRQN